MPWYAVHTKSRHEDKVHLGLTQRSIDAFLPKMEVWSKRKDRRKRINIPMFGGYLFIDIEELTNEKKLAVLTTPGVVRILGKPNSHVPVPIPDSQIDAIQRLIAANIEIAPYDYLKVGEMARIVDGPFRGIEGKVVERNVKRDLFVVSIDLMQRSVAIKLEGFQVEKV